MGDTDRIEALVGWVNTFNPSPPIESLDDMLTRPEELVSIASVIVAPGEGYNGSGWNDAVELAERARPGIRTLCRAADPKALVVILNALLGYAVSESCQDRSGMIQGIMSLGPSSQAQVKEIIEQQMKEKTREQANESGRHQSQEVSDLRSQVASLEKLQEEEREE
ncbi:unnamed protein product, partial [Chrysoparadoxa australica]